MELNYALGVIEAMAQHADEGPPSDEECRAVNAVVAHVRESERIRAAEVALIEAAEAWERDTKRPRYEGYLLEAVRNLQAAKGE